MEHLTFDYDGPAGSSASSSITAGRDAVVVGVVSSGNLEVMIEGVIGASGCRIDVQTPARGFDLVWRAVLADFVERSRLDGVRISIHDVGATPAVVSLRLDQAVEEYRSGAAS